MSSLGGWPRLSTGTRPFVKSCWWTQWMPTSMVCFLDPKGWHFFLPPNDNCITSKCCVMGLCNILLYIGWSRLTSFIHFRTSFLGSSEKYEAKVTIWEHHQHILHMLFSVRGSRFVNCGIWRPWNFDTWGAKMHRHILSSGAGVIPFSFVDLSLFFAWTCNFFGICLSFICLFFK